MSFYGNSYHYSAESFARVVLNAILESDSYTTDTPSGFIDVVHSDQGLQLDAHSRKSGLGIESGNHWIKLVYNDENSKFGIMHNNPGPTEYFILPFNKMDATPIDDIKEANKLKFGDTISISKINYDIAGHVIKEDHPEVEYYQMPDDPAVELRGRMNDIDGIDFKEGQTDTSLKRQLLDRMNTIDGKDDNGEGEDPTSLAGQFKTQIDNMEDWESRISQTENKAADALKKATDTADNFETIRQAVIGAAVSIADIQKDLEEIKKELGMT